MFESEFVHICVPFSA